MTNPMKIRAIAKDGATEIKVLISHDMETGYRKDLNGELVPAWFIQNVVVKLADQVLVDTQWGPAISKNPFIGFKVKGGQVGDIVAVTWTDNRGETRTDTAAVMEEIKP